MAQKAVEITDLDKALAAVIDKLREEHGLSGRKLSSRANLPFNRVARRLRLEAPFLVSEVNAIAAVFNLKGSRLLLKAEQHLETIDYNHQVHAETETGEEYALAAQTMTDHDHALTQQWDQHAE
ncbi:helix-turn-helix domain-containing protein [Canibacter zhoujuaniae]|uniref:helix-turn-helix domain-containing protein n=1 Tax=Canibacter zhoujuaniae TaxID=2708343 RepID=UPI0014226692|nr:hypothetical protein [Canibacter zhoujuaniae]